MKKKFIISLLILGLFATACGGSSDPEVIKWGFIPAEEAEALADVSEPFVEFMSDYIGIPVEASITQDYAGAITGLGSGQLDVAGLGPLGYVLAQQQYPDKVEAISKAVRYGSATYHGQIVTNDPSVCKTTPVIGAWKNVDGTPQIIEGSATTPPDVVALQVGWTFGDNGLEPEVLESGETVSPGYACEADLTSMIGKRIAAADAASTSGYLFPGLAAQNAGIDLDDDIDLFFAGGHSGVIQALYNGDADFGFSYDDARRTIRKENPDVGEKLIVIGISPEIPNDVIAVNSDMSQELKDLIYEGMQAFLAQGEESEEFFDLFYGWTEAEPVEDSEFDPVREAQEAFGITEP